MSLPRALVLLAVGLLASGCGSSTPTAPTTPNTPATKIIVLAGNLSFGNVNFGTSATATFTIGNQGTATLTFTGIVASNGTGNQDIKASPTSGTVAPGASVTVTITFTPTIAQFYTSVLQVQSDATSGNAGINFNGTGVNNTPIFTMSGVGNTIFEIPSTVTKLHITASLASGSSNFVVWSGPPGAGCGVNINGGCHLLVNDLVGPLFGNPNPDEGILATGAPTATEITVMQSSGVSWTMTEVR
jgi:Abnormal spindle-like microcephaly-assoc'd, ASPM-SPD-2-Hydin